MPRRAVKLAAALAVAGLAVSACGSVQMGAAALAGSSRISTSTLTSHVTNLMNAYKADQAKGIKPQRPAGQEAQQVLTWLILFRIYDEIASQHNINVTPAQAQKQQALLTSQASQNKVTLNEYVSAVGALPPDLVPQLDEYFAIRSTLGGRIDGGKAPTTSAAQAQVLSQIQHAQCVAAKSLGVKVNPQFGEFNYANYSVVAAPPTLAADPTPSASSSPPVLTPPC